MSAADEQRVPGYSVRIFSVGEFGAVNGPSVCIDVQAPYPAPGQELLRVQWDAKDGYTRDPAFAFQLFGLCLPLVIRGVQKLTIFHDFENAGVILASVPSDAKCIHGASPAGGCSRRMAEPGGASSSAGGGGA